MVMMVVLIVVLMICCNSRRNCSLCYHNFLSGYLLLVLVAIEKIQQLNEERRQLREQLNLATDLGEIERIKGAYQSLLAFTFQNLRQQTDFDPAHAKNYWENLVK